ncbi:hypothetical protein IAT40_006413 [Kwoniella sp. CBS 6097]
MPSLATAGTLTTVSSSTEGMTGTSTAINTDPTASSAATATSQNRGGSGVGTETGTSTSTNATSTAYVYSYATSKIVRTAVAAGVIVLALTALVLFFKISSWIRYHQHLRRQRYLSLSLQSEQRANAYEIAAWAEQPGTAPIHPSDRDQNRRFRGGEGKKRRKEIKEEIRAIKRGGANAWAVKEWEGVAS